MNLVATVLAAVMATAPSIPPVGARAQAYIQKEAADPELRQALEAYVRTVREMMIEKDNSQALGLLVRQLERRAQCVEDLVGKKEEYRLTEGVLAQLIDREQLMVDWLTANGNLPAPVMQERHEITCAK